MPMRVVRAVRPYLTAKNIGDFLVYVSAFVTALLIVWMLSVTNDTRRISDNQRWIYQRDRAKDCINDWDRYNATERLYVDIPEALIEFGTSQGMNSATPEQIAAFRAVFQARFAEFPQPVCDLDEAKTAKEEAEGHLSSRGVNL